MPFKYLRDPLFLFCVALYFVNRFLLKPVFPVAFFHNYLNDVICIPFWVPIMLWGMKITRLRREDLTPQCHEVILPLVMWSVVFEIVLPGMREFRHAHADVNDILAYTVGAALAVCWWEWFYCSGVTEVCVLKAGSVEQGGNGVTNGAPQVDEPLIT